VIAKFRFGPQQHLPGAAKAVEVIHVQAAQKGLQGIVDVCDRDPESLRLVRIQLHLILRHGVTEDALDKQT